MKSSPVTKELKQQIDLSTVSENNSKNAALCRRHIYQAGSSLFLMSTNVLNLNTTLPRVALREMGGHINAASKINKCTGQSIGPHDLQGPFNSYVLWLILLPSPLNQLQPVMIQRKVMHGVLLANVLPKFQWPGAVKKSSQSWNIGMLKTM